MKEIWDNVRLIGVAVAVIGAVFLALQLLPAVMGSSVDAST